MKKRTLPFVLCLYMLTLVGCTNNKEAKTHLEELNLNGGVKSVKTSNYEVKMKFDEIMKDDLVSPWWLPLVDVFIYTHLGVLDISNTDAITFVIFNKEGMVVEKEEYDETYRGDIELKQKTKYEWVGRDLLKVSIFDEDGLQFERANTYEKGKLTQSTEYRSKSLSNVTKCTTDSKGRILKWETYNEDGEIEQTGENEYDKNHIVKSTIIGLDGKSEIVTQKYENQRLVERNYGESGTTERYKYKNERIISYSKSGKESSFIYNKNGDIVKFVDEDNEEYSFEYIYDKKNNWTKCITYKRNSPKYIQEREIEYY